MRHLRYSILTFLSFFGALAVGQVLSPRAQEVRFSYTAEFLIQADELQDYDTAASEHMDHIFGILHSPAWLNELGLGGSGIDGVGGAQLPATIEVLNAVEVEDQVLITYRVKGKLLLLKELAAQWLKYGSVSLPLPYDLSQIYNEKCTDDYYTDIGDYWYFYDPFRRGCRYLLKEPYAKMTPIKIQGSASVNESTSTQLSRLRSDNGNGELFSVYYVQGFSDGPRARGDEGRISFANLRNSLKERGFSEEILSQNRDRPQVLLEKAETLPNGMPVLYQVNALLVNSDIDSRSPAFAKFFKQAVRDADVLIYAGHSGLGGNLDIPSLEEKAGRFEFNNEKKQIFYFESCSSYSYYLQHFRERKTKANLDVVSNGLSSLFDATNESMLVFLDELFDSHANPTWLELLNKVEKPLNGASYLLNVGL